MIVKFRRNNKERYWSFTNKDLWYLKELIERIMGDTTETKLEIIIERKLELNDKKVGK